MHGEHKEVSVITGSMYRARAHRTDIGVHIAVWIASVLGLAAAAIGTYIAVAPDDGSLTVINRTWSTGDLLDTWAPWLLIVGGVFAAIGMAVSVIVDRDHAASRWLVAGDAALGVIGVAAVFAGITLLT
jgi:hypothetical protein